MKNYRIFIFLVFLAAIAGAGAQNINTPYSMYGYGILGDYATSMQRQMGSVGYAMNSGRQINVMNPASYAAIDSLTFLFDIGADATVLWSKEGSAKETTAGGGLDYVTMQFPMGKHMGASIGLLPYSSVGYAFGNDIRHGTMENQGSGGINNAYVGVSGKVAGFSVGFNVGYLFGNIVNDIYSAPQGSGESLFEHVMQIRDWSFTAGVQYTARLNRFNRMTFGLTYSPRKTLLGKSWATVQELKQDSKPDTVGSLKLKGSYYTPTSVGAGISYTYEKASRFTVEADFTWQNWAKADYSPLYSSPEEGKEPVVLFEGMRFNNRTRYAVGAELIPRLRGNYGQRMAIRLGGYYTNDYLCINGNSVKEYGVTCGLGFPTPEGKTMINLGFEWKHRVASPQRLISENYLNITLGVNFNEVWFWKRKIK